MKVTKKQAARLPIEKLRKLGDKPDRYDLDRESWHICLEELKRRHRPSGV